MLFLGDAAPIPVTFYDHFELLSAASQAVADAFVRDLFRLEQARQPPPDPAYCSPRPVASHHREDWPTPHRDPASAPLRLVQME